MEKETCHASSTTSLTCLALASAGILLGAAGDRQVGVGRDPHGQEYRFAPRYGRTFHLPASRDEFATVFTRSLSYRDLDLSSAQGQAALYRRARHAIEHACVLDGPMLSNATSDASCRYHAWRELRPQLAALIRQSSAVSSQ